MISLGLEPHATYNFFQAFGALILGGTFFYGLRRDFTLKERLLLILSLTFLIRPFAEMASLFAAQSQGRSYTGALLAQIVGLGIFLKFAHPPVRVKTKVWNLFAVVSGVVYALLRVGCYFRGCCWGDICPFPWATYYDRPDVITPWLYLPLHPVQLYSAVHGLIVAALVAWYVKKRKDHNALGLFLLLFGGGRLVTDIFRADAKFYEQSLWGFEPNTMLSWLLMAIGVLLLVIGECSRRLATAGDPPTRH